MVRFVKLNVKARKNININYQNVSNCFKIIKIVHNYQKYYYYNLNLHDEII